MLNDVPWLPVRQVKGITSLLRKMVQQRVTYMLVGQIDLSEEPFPSFTLVTAVTLRPSRSLRAVTVVASPPDLLAPRVIGP